MSAGARPDAPAVIIHGEATTYRALDAAVTDCCGRLSGIGIAEGSRLAVLLPSCADYVVIVHAALRSGITLVCLNTRLTVPELAYQCDLAEVTAILCDPTTEAMARSLASGRLVLSVDTPLSDDVIAFAACPIAAFEPVAFDLDRPQGILFTSGTSGVPKGVVLTVGNHFYSAIASTFRIGMLPSDRWLCVLPLFHAGGLAILLRSALYGTAVILHERFDVAIVAESLARDRATLISLVPTQLYRLLQAGAAFPPTLRLILLGGAAATREVILKARALQLPLAITYGLTEAASQVATLPPDANPPKLGSVGKPLAFMSVRVVDAEGQYQPVGEYGEIVIAGAMVAHGYVGKPPFEGVFHTGDIGMIDQDGDLWIIQRRTDLILTGGENVYPVEVEMALRRHGSVADALVVGLLDAEWGQQVAALIIPADPSTFSEDVLLGFLRRILAGYKIPRRFKIIDALPMTASGKPDRRVAATLFEGDV